MNEMLDNKKAVTDCTWADTCINAQTTPLIRKNFKNEFEYCVPNADKKSKVFNIKDRQNDLSVLYDKYPEAKKLVVYYPQLTATFKEQLDEEQEEKFRNLIGKKIKIVDLEQEPENSPYFGKVGEIQEVQVDPFGDVVLYGTWGGIGVYPKYDSFVVINEESLDEDVVNEEELDEAFESWKADQWIDGHPRNVARMNNTTIRDYANYIYAKARMAYLQNRDNMTRDIHNMITRCIHIICDLRNQASINGARDVVNALESHINDLCNLGNQALAAINGEPVQQPNQDQNNAENDTEAENRGIAFWEEIKQALSSNGVEYREIEDPEFGDPDLSDIVAVINIDGETKFAIDSEGNIYYGEEFTPYEPENGYDINELFREAVINLVNSLNNNEQDASNSEQAENQSQENTNPTSSIQGNTSIFDRLKNSLKTNRKR